MNGIEFKSIDGNIDYNETNLNPVRKMSENDKNTCTTDQSNNKMASDNFNEETEQTNCIKKELNAQADKSHYRAETLLLKNKENYKANGTKDRIRRLCPALVLTAVVFLCIFTALAVFISQYKDSNCSNCEKENPPHIVLVLSDDQGWNDIGWHNPDVLTPNLIRLGKQGVILENSYVQPVCTPSRAAILTGKYPFRTGLQWLVVENHQPKFLPTNITILPELLKERGYTTHIVGKWHLGHCSEDVIPTKRGFDSFLGILKGGGDYYSMSFGGNYDFWKNEDIYFPPEGSYSTDLFTDRAVEIIENNDGKTSPLFLQISYTTPHFPLQVPKTFKDMYPNVTDANRQTYLGMVSSLDYGIGKVVNALERNDYMDNTVFIFLADNGGDLDFGSSNLPLRGDKGDLWEGGTKSVGLVYSPKYLGQSGCIHYGMIHAVDWFSTILDIAKYQQESDHLDSVSQWEHLKECSGSARSEFVYNIDDDIAMSAALRVDNYKIIVGDPRVYNFNASTFVSSPIDPSNTEVRLFNLYDDPSETRNIASENPIKVKTMLRKLDEYRKDSVTAANPDYLPKNITHPNGVLRLDWC
ncbi:arylsulfatase B-like isoform X2 [Mytilus trossulus]|uniref:arylsulfatase B-like isoform X2 n=1 Tax=Mytilus trossulus TaxID=6551 RepID=UPI0030077F47